jgi:outer membrane protein OmpA-like peptidoglycan-associated protein/tetratricopeptide (TPR) repeat protein
MRFSFTFILLLSFLLSFSQRNLSTDDRKAIKYFDKANEAISDRNFQEALKLYVAAIERDPNFREAHYRLFAAHNLLRNLDTAFYYLQQYERLTDPATLDGRDAFVLGREFYERAYYEKARDYILLADSLNSKLFDSYLNNLLKESILYSAQNYRNVVEVEKEQLPSQVNRYFTQYFPVITIDESMLIFTKRDGYQVNYDEDLVVSYQENGKWGEATSLSKNINSRYNEGAATISADGRILIFTSCDQGKTFGSCDLFISTREGMIWSEPVNMGSSVNSVYWDSQPSLSADGKTLYFSSERPGGMGRKDIWVSRRTKSGWTKPTNLGANVNTPSNEITPYIHVNGRTLFFSSDGRPGFGRLDLFVAQKRDSLWLKPQNLGAAVNNNEDQLSWVLNADGTSAYYSEEFITKERELRSDIVEIRVDADSLIVEKSAYITGRVRDKETSKPLKATIRLYDLESSEMQYNTDSDPVSGIYFIALNEGKEYGVYVSSEGYLFEDFHFEPKERAGLQPDTLNILLEPIKEGSSFVLENVYFEFDSYKLSNKSQSELQEVAEFLKENQVSVLVEGHTDLKGSDEYNQKLSENRARAVYEYLLDLGVPRAQLQYKGFGYSKPLVKDEENQYKNRRIEFRISTN